MSCLIDIVVFNLYRRVLGIEHDEYQLRPASIRSVQEEKEFLARLGKPKSDIEASFFQYKCQIFTSYPNIRFEYLNIIFFFVFIIMAMFFFFKSLFMKREDKKRNLVTHSFLLEQQLLPEEIVVKDDSIVAMERGRGVLTCQDLCFLAKILMKYPSSFFFISKCMYLVAGYSYYIQKYHPAVIYCSAEYSFASSVLTMYCERFGIEHCNIMHGTPEYEISYSFARFSKCYIWDIFFIHLFENLNVRTNISNYIICKPSVPNVIIKTDINICTYYLQIHNQDELEKIKICLDKTGKRYKVRPHPLHNHTIIHQIFGEDNVEDPLLVNIWESLANAGTVISTYSTVLYQAHLLNIPVVIDDVSNQMLFEATQERKFIMFYKPHKLLSNIMIKNR